MKNIFVIIALSLTTLSYGQSLLDTMNLDSINYEFLNEMFVKKIVDQRKLYGASEIVKDTTPMASAKYHTDYFLVYNDTSSTHNSNNSLPFYYLGDSTPYQTNFSTAQSRLFNVGIFLNQVNDNLEVSLVNEFTFFCNLERYSQITYKEFIGKIFNNLIDNGNKKEILYDYTNDERYVGISSVKKNNHFMLTLVISTKSYK